MSQTDVDDDTPAERDRYGRLRIDDDVIVYDRENADAWIRAPAAATHELQ